MIFYPLECSHWLAAEDCSDFQNLGVLTLGVITRNISSMSPDLRSELRQRKPFESLQQETHLNLVRTVTMLQDTFEQLFKPYGISNTQYNVLRILRGADGSGLCRNELRDRLLTRMPDVTRLLDRMEEVGLVERARDTADRRQVTTRLTKQGRRRG